MINEGTRTPASPNAMDEYLRFYRQDMDKAVAVLVESVMLGAVNKGANRGVER